MDRVSVVILPGGPAGDAVRATLESWTRSGISTPMLVVGASGVVVAPPEPVRVTARLLDRQGAREVDLFSFCGRFRLDRVRIVVAQLLPTHEDADAELSRAADTVAAAVQASLPLDPTGRPITRLHRTVLVIPASGIERVQQDILLPAWEANVVISPEDRSDVDRPSMFVRASDNLAGHAAAAVAAAAGVIRGVPAGAFDTVTSDSSTRADDVVVARVTIRTVVGEDMLDALVQRVLDPGRLAPTGPARVVSDVSLASEPDVVVHRAASVVLSSADWAPSPAPPMEHPETSVSHTLRGIGDAARFNLRTTAAVAAWSMTRGRDHLDAVATEALVGTGVGAVVTVGPRATGSVGTVALDAIESQRRALDERLAFEATRGSPPPPSTWRRLRELAFGLADGGPVAGVGDLIQYRKREVLAPHDVVPDPEDTLEIPGGRVLRPDDPVRARAYRDELSERLRSLRQAMRVVESDLPAVRTEPAAPTLEPSATSLVEESAVARAEPGPSSTDPTPVVDRGPRQDETGRDARSDAAELENRQTELEALDEHHQEFVEWFGRVSGSVLWRVGDDVARRLVEVQRSRHGFLSCRDDVAAPVTASLERSKERLLRVWWWTVPVTVVALLVLFLAAGLVVADPEWLVVLGLAAGIAIVAILVVLTANHAFYKAFLRYEWDLAHVLAQQRHDAELYLWEGKELARLRALFEGWQDWAAIIGEVLHRTWVAPSVVFEDLPEEVVQRLPAAVAVARQEEEQRDLPVSLVVRAYQELYRKGWATQAFSDAYSQFATRLSGDGTSGYLDADMDGVADELSARSQLLEFWRSADGRALTGQRQYQRLRRLAHDGELDLPHRVVRRIGPLSDDARIDEPDYFAPTTSRSTTFALDMFGPRARNENRHYVHRTDVWLPRVARRAGQQTGTEEIRVDQATASTALRVDVSRRIHPDELTLFEAPSRVGPTVRGEVAEVRSVQAARGAESADFV